MVLGDAVDIIGQASSVCCVPRLGVQFVIPYYNHVPSLCTWRNGMYQRAVVYVHVLSETREFPTLTRVIICFKGDLTSQTSQDHRNQVRVTQLGSLMMTSRLVTLLSELVLMGGGGRRPV